MAIREAWRYFVISEAGGDALAVRVATSAVCAFLVCVNGARIVPAIPKRFATREDLLPRTPGSGRRARSVVSDLDA
jgi:hypothetical protein